MGLPSEVVNGLAMAGHTGLKMLNSVAKKGGVIRQLEGIARQVGRTALNVRKGEWEAIKNAFVATDTTAGATAFANSGSTFSGAVGKGFKNPAHYSSTRSRIGVAQEMFGNWWSGKSLTGVEHPHMAQRAALRQAAVYGGGIAVGANMIFGGHRRRR